MRDPYQIIERPLLTEKTMDLSYQGKYTFKVAKDANKIEIGKAIETMFNVTVMQVNTMVVRGKKRRVGRNPEGRTTNWKKAIVTLAEGQTLNVFEGL